MRENEKVSATKEAHENVESDFDDNKIYQIYNMSLEETKEKLELNKCAFECKLENIYGFKIEII